jgi:hypothetical protein
MYFVNCVNCLYEVKKSGFVDFVDELGWRVGL